MMQKEQTLLVVHVDNGILVEDDTILTSPSFCRRPPTQPPPSLKVTLIPLSTTPRSSSIARPYSQSFHYHPTQPAPASPPPKHNFKCSNSIITN